MTVIDVERLLQPISGDRPCGDDLEYDPAFGAMERLAQGKPSQQIGDAVVPAEAPDWGKLRDTTSELLGRTKDLRVATQLTRALLRTDGLPGFAAGLAVVRGLTERFWGDVHPRLDPSDGSDPTMRINSVVALRDNDAFLAPLRETPLVSSRALGRFSLRDVQVVAGTLPASAGRPAPDAASLEGAFKEVPIQDLQAVLAAVDSAIAEVDALEKVFTAQLMATKEAAKKAQAASRALIQSSAPGLAPLVEVLRAARSVLGDRLDRRGAGAGAGAASPAAASGAGSPAVVVAGHGEINSREDALRGLDRIIEWYSRNEPSSPVPLLLSRAKRLVAKSFLEILKDMAPAGVAEAASVGGVSPEESSRR